MINGKRARGKHRHKYIDRINEAANTKTTEESLRAINDRNQRRIETFSTFSVENVRFSSVQIFESYQPVNSNRV